MKVVQEKAYKKVRYLSKYARSDFESKGHIWLTNGFDPSGDEKKTLNDVSQTDCGDGANFERRQWMLFMRIWMRPWRRCMSLKDPIVRRFLFWSYLLMLTSNIERILQFYRKRNLKINLKRGNFLNSYFGHLLRTLNAPSGKSRHDRSSLCDLFNWFVL